MTQQTRTEIAEQIAREAIVFVRKARQDGNVNKVTAWLLQDCAQVLGYGGEDYSLRTVQTIVRRNARLMDETNLIDF